ncbi:MAG TPA: hypothetical protein VNQ73_16480 [Ilumatobacter sp.]|nr:hypothetical protein [Ilumatobacter sp.]
MDLAAARSELAGLAPAGFTGYDHLPGVAQLPAWVVGLPQRITAESARLFRVLLPVFVIVGNPYTPEGEAQLLAGVASAADLLGLAGSTFKAATWADIDSFRPITIGQTEHIGAVVNLEVLIS